MLANIPQSEKRTALPRRASLAFIWGWLAAIVIIGLPILENIETVIAVITWSPVSKQPAKYSTTADGEKKESPTSAVPVSSA
eukprot:1072643-Pleurochrysis_carterae.AAC.3